MLEVGSLHILKPNQNVSKHLDSGQYKIDKLSTSTIIFESRKV